MKATFGLTIASLILALGVVHGQAPSPPLSITTPSAQSPGVTLANGESRLALDVGNLVRNVEYSNELGCYTYASSGAGALRVVVDDNTLAVYAGGSGGAGECVNWTPKAVMGHVAAGRPALEVYGPLRIHDAADGTRGEIEFSNGSRQAAAGGGAVAGQVGPQGPRGEQGEPGPPVHTSAVCSSNTPSNRLATPCSRRTASILKVPGGSCNVSSDTGSCSAAGAASGVPGIDPTYALCAVCVP